MPMRKMVVNMLNAVSVRMEGPLPPPPNMEFSTRIPVIAGRKSPSLRTTSSMWHAALTVVGTDIALRAVSQICRQITAGLSFLKSSQNASLEKISKCKIQLEQAIPCKHKIYPGLNVSILLREVSENFRHLLE